MARWQSGYAAVCKTVDAGSIPTLASNYLIVSPGGGIGRRYGLKIRCPKGRAGSIQFYESVKIILLNRCYKFPFLTRSLRVNF